MPDEFHVPTAAELRDDLRNKIGSLEMRVENLKIEKEQLIATMAERSAKYATLNAKYDREVGDNVRLRAALKDIADHRTTCQHPSHDGCFWIMENYARKALEPQG